MSPINRRQLLRGSGLALLATLLADGTSWAAAAPPSDTPITVHPLLGILRPMDADPAVGGPGASFLAPFSATSSATLSEDYFLTNEVIMDSSDIVLPFQRPDGTIEALVQNGTGAVSYLSRDSSSSSGWDYTQIQFPADQTPIWVSDMAVGLGSDGNVYAILIEVNYYGYQTANWMSLAPDSQTWSVADPDEPELIEDQLGSLQTGIDPSGGRYMYCVNPDNSINVWLPQQQYLGSSYLITGLTGGPYSSAQLLWNSAYDSTDPASIPGSLIVVDGTGSANLYTQHDGSSIVFNVPLAGGDGLQTFVDVLWMDWQSSPANFPQYALQDNTGLISYADGLTALGAVSQLDAVAGQAAIWTQGGYVSLALLVGNTANIVTEYDSDPSSIEFTPPIPIAGDLLALAGCPTDPNQGTLFVVDVASTLNILTKDLTSGLWTATSVHQATASTQELDCWRTQLSLTDANGLPLSNCQVTITPDRAIGIWQPSGSTDLVPGPALKMTTDSFGQLTFGIPATDLDTAILTVQVLQNGSASGDPITVNPAQNVHDFFSGAAPLDGVGSLTSADGSALVNAQNPDGTPLFPVLANISDPAAQSQAAAGVAASINQCMNAAQLAPPGPNDIQSFTLDLSGSVPTYTPSMSPTQVLVGESAWWDKVKHDAESVFRGVRNGLIKVENCISSWAADAGNWVVNLGITIGEAIADTISYTISDIKSAIHAISGFFQTLGADIKSAINWLRTNIKETFDSAESNAQTLITWMKSMTTQVDSDLQFLAALESGYFSQREQAITDELNNVTIPGSGGLTLGQFNSSNSDSATGDSSGTETVGSASEVVADVAKVWHIASGGWLMDKIKSEFDSGNQTEGSSDPLTTALNNLISVVTSTSWLTGIADTLWDTFKADSTKDISNTNELTVVVLLQMVEALVPQLLAFADAVITAIIGVAEAMVDEWVDMLETNLLQLPLIGEILSWFGVDETLSVGHLFGLILMFPTTIAYRVKFGGDGVMFQNAPATSETGDAADAVADPLGADLIFAHAAIRGFGALVDALVDVAVYNDDGNSDPDDRKSPLKWVGYLDTVFTAAISVVSYPGLKNSDGTTAIPFSTPVLDLPDPDDVNRKVFARYLLGWAIPILSGSAQMCQWADLSDSYTKWSPFARSAIGAAIFGLGIDINVEKSATNQVTVSAALEAVPTMVAPLALAAINADSFDIPLAVKLLVDALLEPVAAILIAAEAD